MLFKNQNFIQHFGLLFFGFIIIMQKLVQLFCILENEIEHLDDLPKTTNMEAKRIVDKRGTRNKTKNDRNE